MLWGPFPEGGPGPGVTWPMYSFQNHRHPWAAGACGCGDELKASECGVCGF